jgi:hypothetical protein
MNPVAHRPGIREVAARPTARPEEQEAPAGSIGGRDPPERQEFDLRIVFRKKKRTVAKAA